MANFCRRNFNSLAREFTLKVYSESSTNFLVKAELNASTTWLVCLTGRNPFCGIIEGVYCDDSLQRQ